ncbi:hypothetical protein ACG2QI_00250 [Bacillus sp. GM2]|uniref:hypothetical protein n=1 Tax=Bacillus sp. GM2 TaxID=3373599 RepID=UPI003F932379
MTKTNEKIHVLADESLGGIKREYVEVDRKAKVGDMVVLPGEGNSAEHVVEVRGFEGDYKLESGFYIRQDFVNTLEPTNIAHIDGPDGPERYEMVDRKPEIGEKVIVTESDDFPKGFVDSVKEVDDFHDNGSFFLVNGVLGENFLDAEYEEYRVLVPVESSEEEPQPSDPIDVIANLATRVAELERENKRIKDEIDTLHKDNRRHGEELEALKYAAKETDGKVAHLEADSDMRLFTAEEVAALLNAMRERR